MHHTCYHYFGSAYKYSTCYKRQLQNKLKEAGDSISVQNTILIRHVTRINSLEHPYREKVDRGRHPKKKIHVKAR